jgi:protein tyrosine phosphatase
MVTDQIAVLNSAYASARFRFTLSNVYKHTNKNWCVVMCSAHVGRVITLMHLHLMLTEANDHVPWRWQAHGGK